MIKVTFNIQSISDIITNSSSEVFCKIDSKDEVIKEQILKVMKNLFPGDDYDMEPVVAIYDKTIDLSLPYDVTSFEFYREGIEAILDNRFGKDNYTITYEY